MTQSDEIVEFDAVKISHLMKLDNCINSNKWKNKLCVSSHKSDTLLIKKKNFFSSLRKPKRTFAKAYTFEKSKEHGFMETTLPSEIGTPKWTMPGLLSHITHHQHNFSSINSKPVFH